MARYVIFSAHYEPFLGGIANFTKNLSEELDSMGHEAFIVTSSHPDKPLREDAGEHIHILRLPSLLLIGGRYPVILHNYQTRQMLAELLEGSIDAILINARFYLLTILALRFARKKKIRPLILEHGSNYLTFNNSVLDFFERGYERAITAIEKRFNPKFLAVSERSAEWLQNFGIRTAEVLPNAIDADKFRNLRNTTNYREQLGISPTDCVVVYNGRLLKDKGTEFVLESARIAPEYKFVFAGDGPLKDRVSKTTGSLPNAYYLGRLTSDQVSDLYSEADFNLLPSRTEGFPTSALEAAAWGIPTLLTDVGGVKELYGSRSGEFVIEKNPASIVGKLNELHSLDCDKKKALKDFMKNVASEHSWKETARLFLQYSEQAQQKA